jgi:hypothetical protein
MQQQVKNGRKRAIRKEWWHWKVWRGY